MITVYIAESYYRKGLARRYTFKEQKAAEKFMGEHKQDGRKVWSDIPTQAVEVAA